MLPVAAGHGVGFVPAAFVGSGDHSRSARLWFATLGEADLTEAAAPAATDTARPCRRAARRAGYLAGLSAGLMLGVRLSLWPVALSAAAWLALRRGEGSRPSLRALYEQIPLVDLRGLGERFRDRNGPPAFFFWRKFCAETPDLRVSDIVASVAGRVGLW